MRAASDAVPAEPDAAATVLYSERRVDWLPDGRLSTRTRQVARVDKPSSIRGLATFGASWQPMQSERPTLRARVIDVDGTARAPDLTQFAESPYGSTGPDRFDDMRIIAGPLPRLTVGTITETESITVSKGPVFASGVRVGLPLISDALHHRVEWRVPDGVELTMAVVDSAVEPTSETVDGAIVWRADVRRAPGVDTGLRRVGDDEDPPWDAVIEPRVVLGTASGWDAAAREYHAIVEQALTGGVEASLSADLPADARAAARLVTRRIQGRVRYTGVHFGEGAVIPRSAAAVLDEGFGDCKDMAVLFVGAMRAAGHDARVVLVRASGVGVDARVPGLGAFDHAIARVEAEPPVWVDLTADSLLAGELTPQLYGRRALVIDPETTELTPLPRPPAQANRFAETQRWRIGAGTSTVSMDLEISGASARYLRTSAAVWPQFGPDFVGRLLESRFAAEAEPELRSAAPYPAEVIRLGGTVQSPLGWSDDEGSGVWYSAASLFDLLPPAVRGDEPPRGSTLHAPFVDELRITVEAPPGHAPVEGPTLGTHRLGPATLTIEQGLDGGHPSWTWRFESGPRRWSADDVKAFRAAVAPLVSADQRAQLRFEHRGHRALAEGRIGEGLRVYRDLAGSGAVEARQQYAERLAEHGYPDFARRIAEALVEQHPERAEVWETLGYTRLNGLNGPLTTGHDRAGAIAALEEALALDADLEWAPQGLMAAHGSEATGLRSNADGVEQALAVARRYPRLRVEAAELALMRGRPAEALELLGGADGDLAAAVFLAATTMVDEPGAGLAGARRRMKDPRALDEVAATALNRLLNLRAYPEMRTLLAKIRPLVGFDLSPAVWHRIERFSPAAPDTPEAALAGLLYHLILQSEPPALAEYATPELIAELPRTSLAAGMDDLADRLQRNGALDRPAAADLFLSSTLGSEALLDGLYMVHLQDGPRKYFALVSRTDDGLRVSAVPGTAPALFGRRIADALDRGAAPEAMAWRLWAVARAEPPAFIPAAWDDPFALAAALTTRGGDASLPLTAAALLSGGGAEARARARSIMAGVPPEALRAGGDGLALALRMAVADTEADLRAMVEAHLEREPDAPVSIAVRAGLMQMGGEIEQADAYLSGLPRPVAELPAIRARRMEAAASAGRFADAEALGAALMATADGPDPRNGRAWGRLFVPGADLAEAIGWLEALPTDDLGVAGRHTLATLYAATGRAADARMALEVLIRERGFTDIDWLVVGWIAEAEGLPEAARDAYLRLVPAADGPRDSTARLARARLAALERGTLADR